MALIEVDRQGSVTGEMLPYRLAPLGEGFREHSACHGDDGLPYQMEPARDDSIGR